MRMQDILNATTKPSWLQKYQTARWNQGVKTTQINNSAVYNCRNCLHERVFEYELWAHKVCASNRAIILTHLKTFLVKFVENAL